MYTQRYSSPGLCPEVSKLEYRGTRRLPVEISRHGASGSRRERAAFTLIELLIVVAIIAILAAIAVPNFLEAQTRSKVSRVKADMRTVGVAIEAYRTDHNRYPPDFAYRANNGDFNVNYITVRWGLVPVTTPVAYLTSLPGTGFQNMGSRGGGDYNTTQKDMGAAYEMSQMISPNPAFYTPLCGYYKSALWSLRDPGPDLIWWNTAPLCAYDPSNGTVSRGDILRFGP